MPSCVRFAHYDVVGTRTLVDDDRAASSGSVGRTAGEATARSREDYRDTADGLAGRRSYHAVGEPIKHRHSYGIRANQPVFLWC